MIFVLRYSDRIKASSLAPTHVPIMTLIYLTHLFACDHGMLVECIHSEVRRSYACLSQIAKSLLTTLLSLFVYGKPESVA